VKLVVNRCYGGFGINHRGRIAYAKEKGIKLYLWLHRDAVSSDYATLKEAVESANSGNGWAMCSIVYSTVPKSKYTGTEGINWYDNEIRSDPALIKVVETMGKDCFDEHAKLEVIEIPDDICYDIDEHDGYETVHETHRSW